MLNSATETLTEENTGGGNSENIIKPLSKEFNEIITDMRVLDPRDPDDTLFDEDYDIRIWDKLEKPDTTPPERFIKTFKGRMTRRRDHYSEDSKDIEYKENLAKRKNILKKFHQGEINDAFADDSEKVSTLIDSQNDYDADDLGGEDDMEYMFDSELEQRTEEDIADQERLDKKEVAQALKEKRFSRTGNRFNRMTIRGSSGKLIPR
jgi:hypothetical protein